MPKCSNRPMSRFYSIVYLHVDLFIDFVRQCASVCEGTNIGHLLDIFLRHFYLCDCVRACSTICGCVRACPTMCDRVRACLTVCDHAQLPEWPTVFFVI